MSDYIERRLAVLYSVSGRVRTIDGEEWMRRNDVRNALLHDVPAADVVERKKGKWIDGDSRRVTAVCSVCGRLRLGNGADYCNKSIPFCERCGADMRQED